MIEALDQDPGKFFGQLHSIITPKLRLMKDSTPRDRALVRAAALISLTGKLAARGNSDTTRAILERCKTNFMSLMELSGRPGDGVIGQMEAIRVLAGQDYSMLNPQEGEAEPA